MMNYPLTKDFRSRIKPFPNLLLLWTRTERESVERKRTIAKIATQDAFDIIRRPGGYRSFLACLYWKDFDWIKSTSMFRYSRIPFIRDVEERR